MSDLKILSKVINTLYITTMTDKASVVDVMGLENLKINVLDELISLDMLGKSRREVLSSVARGLLTHNTFIWAVCSAIKKAEHDAKQK